MTPSDRLNLLRNIGIVAHVDAGKTTLAEQMLYLSGKIRTPGRVDTGTSQLDWLPTEKQRGITILAATTAFEWKGYQVNLIDTPGHVDFSSETRRALRVLDGVIVLISGAEGVQAHTLTLWKAIQSLGIPAIIFINKLDLRGVEPQAVLNDIHSKLTPHAVLLQLPSDFREAHPILGIETPTAAEVRTRLIEKLADYDDAVLESFVEENRMEDTWLRSRLRNQVHRGNIQPVLMGSALRRIGVQPLLDAIIDLFPPPKIVPADSELSAVVFKVQREPRMGRMTFVRLYGGELVNRQLIENTTQALSEKVSQIRKIHANAYEDVGRVTAGDIAALCGLEHTRIGDILGKGHAIPQMPEMPLPVFQVRAFPMDSKKIPKGTTLPTADTSIEETADIAEYVALVEAMKELEDEEPNLEVYWNPDIRELRVRVMGMVQVEILQSLLQERFGVSSGFGKPTVIFKETPVAAGYGSVHYTSVPHWAVLQFLIEPAVRGGGLTYTSQVRPGDLKIRYQREVERRVPLALQQGLKGWEVTDLKVTLIEGSSHEQHTHPLDFVAATGWAIEAGLKNCSTQLLEPILAFHIHAPAEAGGRICNELFNRRGLFDKPRFHGSLFSLEGEVPASTVLDFPLLIQRWSGGKAAMTTYLSRYDLAPEAYNADPANVQPRRETVSFRTYM